MSAEKLLNSREETEIIYVLFPNQYRTGNPTPVQSQDGTKLSMASRVWEFGYNSVWKATHSSAWRKATTNVQCLVGAVIFTINALIVLYALYYLKSMMGIDIFAHQHLENFFPIPGYERWHLKLF